MGFAKMMLICLSLVVAGVGQAQTFESTHHTSHPADGNWVELQGDADVMIPAVNLARIDACWTYPYSIHPVYIENQTIRGTFFGDPSQADGWIRIIPAILHYSSFMSAVGALDGTFNITDSDGVVGAFSSNATGDASFSIPGMAAGLYALYIVDETSSTVLAASPLLVTEKVMEVAAPSEISAGDLLPVKVQVANWSEGRPLVFGAIMLSDRDYRGLDLNITGDGTISGTQIAVAWKDDEFEIQGDFHPEWELFAELLMIFPENSAAAVQDSPDGEVDLNLITEKSWVPGPYVLTCCSISEGTVVGINQTAVLIL